MGIDLMSSYDFWLEKRITFCGIDGIMMGIGKI